MSESNGGVSRRTFLVQTTATLGALAAPTFAPPAVPAESSHRKVLHIIGHSHIDAAWLWPWRDGADIVLTTFRSALDRMNETPGFCYSHSSSAHYRWAERADPSMLAEIRQRAHEGRWEVVGGWPVEPDCNIPATESFVRHCLYGKQYCQRALGADVKIGFNPDSFGHSAGLPTILRRAGYGYYAFMRPQDHEMKLPLLFWWEGLDGSRILVCRIWRDYDANETMIRPAATAAFAEGFDHAAFFLGVGDHGGAVTKEQIAQILAMQKDPTLPELRFSTLGNFFAAIEKSAAFSSLPVVKGELQHHARGCYSAYGEGKFLNRRAERSLIEAETIALWANQSAAYEYPAGEFAASWWKVLFCQFHDMMAGTALYSDYQNVRDSLGYACEVAESTKVEALEMLARKVDLNGVAEGAIFVFNPLPWRRKALVQCYTESNPTGTALITHLGSKEGNTTAVQWRPSESMTPFLRRLCAWVELPPCGYKVFELNHGDAPAGESYIDFAKVSNTGFGISSLKAQDDTELLAGPMGLVVIGDTSDTWAHGINEFRLELGRPTPVSSTLIEDGPVTRVTRQRARWQDSEIVVDIAQFGGRDFLELRFVIDWHEKEQMLKLEIPTALAQPRVFAKVPGQVLERTANGQEEPYQDWAAVQGKIGSTEYTVAVVNNSSYSYDCLSGLFRTVLIRSAPFARHNPGQVPHNDNNAWQDQGRQERKFWMMAARGPWTELALDRRAEELQTLAEYVIDSAHHGTEPWEASGIEIMPSSVWVLAMKQAEHLPGAMIVRLQERAGSSTTATVKDRGLGLDHQVSLSAWELKTLLVKPSKNNRAEIREVSLLEA